MTNAVGHGNETAVGDGVAALDGFPGRMLALAKAVGSTRAGCLEMNMNDEATLDLFTEQAFGPALGRVMMTAIDTMVEAGYRSSELGQAIDLT